MWKEPTKEQAKENSRGGIIIPLPDGLSFRKYCMKCGAEFETVNSTRKLCTRCYYVKLNGGGYDRKLIK